MILQFSLIHQEGFILEPNMVAFLRTNGTQIHIEVLCARRNKSGSCGLRLEKVWERLI